MSLSTALKQLQTRDIKFTTFKTALTHNSMPTSNGWAGIEKKYADLKVPAVTTSSYTSKLQKIYRDNIDFGDKAVQIAVFPNDLSHLFNSLLQVKFKNSFNPPNPFPEQLSLQDLKDLTLQPKLAKVEYNNTRTGFMMYFYARAYETFKEKFPVDQMQDPISIKRFQGFDEVVAIKQIIYLRIDSIYVDIKERRVEFMADATRLSSTDKMNEALLQLKATFRDILTEQADDQWGVITFPLINFFPKIHEVYNGVQGLLVQLGHNTAAGSINNSRMRASLGDLKQDPSHTASMAASTTIEKFSIKKAYSYYKEVSTVYLSIPGKSADTSMPVPTVTTAVIEDCINGAQFNDMMQILR